MTADREDISYQNFLQDWIVYACEEEMGKPIFLQKGQMKTNRAELKP